MTRQERGDVPFDLRTDRYPADDHPQPARTLDLS
jgi:hypothetical protein